MAGINQSTSATPSQAQQQLKDFWPNVNSQIRTLSLTHNDLRTQELPLARIKKIMKLDDDVKMISAEAPVLFAKAAEIFIHELTLRAWIHTEDNKRRTLQRNDIAMAISKYDQFDFLIDIVPRDEIKPAKKEEKGTTVIGAEQVQYYLQLAQQHQQALQHTSGMQILQQTVPSGVQTIQLVQSGSGTQAVMQQAPQIMTQHGGQIVLGGAQFQQAQQQQQQQAGGLQIVQQVVGPDGQIQQIPIQLSANQLQMLRMQLQANQGQVQGQAPLIIQTAPVQQGNATVMTATSQNGTQIIQSS